MRDIELTARFQPADQGQNILRQATEDARVIYVNFYRSWPKRLFSWPWKPWKKYVSKAVPMRVTSQQVYGDEVTFTLERADERRDS